MAEAIPHLLVAEDDAEFRQVLADELVRCGYRVTTADHGGAAAELLELVGLADAELHALVLDVRMPEASGLELLRWLRDDAREIPVVLMSGCIAGLVPVADDLRAVVLPKPFSCAELVRAIEGARAAVAR